MSAILPSPGQRYRHVEAKLRDAEWILAKIFTGVDGVEYASLRASGDPTRLKTLALAIVMDRRWFLRLDNPALQAD
jgi:hypothetical protein